MSYKYIEIGDLLPGEVFYLHLSNKYVDYTVMYKSETEVRFVENRRGYEHDFPNHYKVYIPFLKYNRPAKTKFLWRK